MRRNWFGRAKKPYSSAVRGYNFPLLPFSLFMPFFGQSNPKTLATLPRIPCQEIPRRHHGSQSGGRFPLKKSSSSNWGSFRVLPAASNLAASSTRCLQLLWVWTHVFCSLGFSLKRKYQFLLDIYPSKSEKNDHVRQREFTLQQGRRNACSL